MHIAKYNIYPRANDVYNIYPLANDVLWGRGGHYSMSFELIGTKRFRRLVSENKGHYMMSNSQKERREIVINIINAIKNSSPYGRFLRFNKKLMQWEEIDNNKVMMMTIQTLREEYY